MTHCRVRRIAATAVGVFVLFAGVTAAGAVNISSCQILSAPNTVDKLTTDFRDILRPNLIGCGLDVGATGHVALNFIGSAGSAGGTWLTVFDETQDTPDQTILTGSVSLSADVLIRRFNNTKGAGLLALFNEGPGRKGLVLIVYDAGNADTLVLATVDQAGKLTVLRRVALGAGIRENAWYHVTMDVLISGDDLTVTGRAFRHTAEDDPDSALGTQVGGTLSTPTPLSLAALGLQGSGEVGIVASAFSAVMDSSVTNFAVSLPPAEVAIQCGAVLGPGGTFVLDRDLTCPGSYDKYGPGVLNVREGASLNMNGHTVTCEDGGWGIRVLRATLLNGTVRGCGRISQSGAYGLSAAVSAGGSVVQGMTLIENRIGVLIFGEQEGIGHNSIIGNTAMNGGVGFYAEEAGANTFVNNVATGNDYGGFRTLNRDDVFVGNVAEANQVYGFSTEDGAIFNGNAARNNAGMGFRSGGFLGGVLIGNVAEGNGAHGFDFGESNDLTAKENVADSNVGDGFRLRYFWWSDPRRLRTLTSNRAVNNGGSGIHVFEGSELPPQDPTQKFLNITVSGNTALGNVVDLAGGDPNCLEVLWQDNVFLTKSPDCIQ